MLQKSELGEEPQICVCPHCKYQGYSFVERDPGCCIFLMCTGCVCMGCVAGCCLMPCVVTDFKDVTHYCVNCGLKIGTHPIFFC
ncbi:Oidioi.mRNA.OKI2018_I69.chr2.g6446.t1.cds [Oikopleura dioica]|uniref:Oidioi.mRNA.OKI2018_I69.chr2.g6446.t1.cds n=1 Tax=Oikopleura dioica TaxID=34765 RepID=A0ABN7T346_OIKDI|nr:Oidioi.mRNA.OKI2018_I69.chr2.g6446.t1.cds [Oikopleura dioica]